MKLSIHIADVGPDGHHAEGPVSLAWLQSTLQGGDPDIKATGDGQVKLDLTDAGENNFLVQGHIQAPFEALCSRCVTDLKFNVDEAFQVLVEPLPKDGEGAPQDFELSDDDIGLYHYEGEVLDLEDILRERTLLAVPAAPLCKDDCAGLCNQCGADLNQESCRCQRDDVDVRWAALKDVKLS